MSNFLLDREGLIFFSLCLPLFYWAAFDTERLLRVLSLNRRKSFTRRQVMIIKVPGVFVAFWLSIMILLTLVHKL